MAYLNSADISTGFLPAFDLRELGLELQSQYQAAAPFPHIVIDNFLPEDVLRSCLKKFPSTSDSQNVAFDRSQERLKFQYHPDTLPTELRLMFYGFNSLPFLRVLENITGIRGLIPDPYFFGGGFHEICQGGHLSIHADFNHHKPMSLERRINVLIYLNDEWNQEFGGQLELWDEKMSACVETINPVFNRCVIFNTDSTSFHGNPKPINHPRNISRKSIALYYYTATWKEGTREYTTQFQKRPNTSDQYDLRVKGRELLHALTPPIIFSAARAFKRRVSKAAK